LSRKVGYQSSDYAAPHPCDLCFPRFVTRHVFVSEAGTIHDRIMQMPWKTSDARSEVTTVTVKIPFLWEMTLFGLVQRPRGTSILLHLVAFLSSLRRAQVGLRTRAILKMVAVNSSEIMEPTYVSVERHQRRLKPSNTRGNEDYKHPCLMWDSIPRLQR
jgi:hypothetical protein